MAKFNDIQYDNKVVAFLDILGFKSLVFQNKDDAIKAIKCLDKAISHSLECLFLENCPEWFSARLFSDCICLSCDEHDLLTVLSELAWLQLNLSRWGIFVRGAIDEGLHFENERMIFSEGLINAFEVQKKDAYPRILITDSIIDRVRNERTKYSKNELDAYLIKAPDGLYFLDYLQYIEEDIIFRSHMEDFLTSHKNAIIEQTHANITNQRVVEKYRWLADYHNFKLREFYNTEDYFEDYIEEVTQKLIINSSIFPSFKRQMNYFAKNTREH